MAESLKDKYLNADFFLQLSRDLKAAYPALNQKQFYQQCITPLDSLQLKQCITHTTLTVGRHLPDNYKKSIHVLYDFSRLIDNKFGYIFLSEFVSTFGRQDYKTSIKALRDFTQYSSSEFAIREFLQLDFDTTIRHMLEWAEHDNEHIRRLASEGCRPRLPWANKLPQIIEQPQLSWPILEKLKQDPATYVQKSVANHINDISKDNADWLIKKLQHWNTDTPVTQWIIKHGCRTLIKQGHETTLSLLGFAKPDIEFNSFSLSTNNIEIGEAFEFCFSVMNQSIKKQKLNIDYRIHFMKKNGTLQPKTFKLKLLLLPPSAAITVCKKHAFKIMTTRKLYPGNHRLEILINGISFKTVGFKLLK
ncbi:MAG: DNA alkylation repair protein [Gammaproteobacteria bacterium]|nr:DNA alkylation repair protein [Gammaproteobacteria bacterium]